jgi:polysaccharide biosynthesis transport protein
LGVVEIEQLNAMRKSLRQSGQQVLGMVVNGANERPDRDGKFYIGQKIGSKTVEKSIR